MIDFIVIDAHLENPPNNWASIGMYVRIGIVNSGRARAIFARRNEWAKLHLLANNTRIPYVIGRGIS